MGIMPGVKDKSCHKDSDKYGTGQKDEKRREWTEYGVITPADM